MRIQFDPEEVALLVAIREGEQVDPADPVYRRVNAWGMLTPGPGGRPQLTKAANAGLLLLAAQQIREADPDLYAEIHAGAQRVNSAAVAKVIGDFVKALRGGGGDPDALGS